MLSDRGLKVEYADAALSPVIRAVDSKGDYTFVVTCDEPKLGVRTLRKLKEDAAAGNAKHLIVVCPLGLTHFAHKENAYTSEDAHISTEIFRKSELSFNVTRHELVPAYTALTSQQKKILLSKLSCTTGQLPKMREHDPVARYYRFPKGTVLKIDRSIGALEPNTYFRIVA